MTEKRYIHISDMISLYTRNSLFLDIPDLATTKPAGNLIPDDYAKRHSGILDFQVSDRLHDLHHFLLHGNDDTMAMVRSRDIMRAYLGDKFPFIEELELPKEFVKKRFWQKEVPWERKKAAMLDWLYEAEQKYGAWFEVEPLPNYREHDPAEVMEALGQNPEKLMSNDGRHLLYRNLKLSEVEALPQSEFLPLAQAILSLSKSSSPPIAIQPQQIVQKMYRDTDGEALAIELGTLDKAKATKIFTALEGHFTNTGLQSFIDLHFDTTSLPHQYSIRIQAQAMAEIPGVFKALETYAKESLSGNLPDH